ncbi:MAG: hypothetical protein M3186_16660 [Actinomycetota bacterium]|nr:hypothetical protein [Actinomycetota bacterium]
MRALIRLAVLGGLVIAGWLLGAGISHADEDFGQPDTGLVQLVSDRVDRAAASDAESGSPVGVRPTIGPTINKALTAAPITRLPVQPPVQVDVPKPAGALQPLVVEPLASALAPVTRTVSGALPAIRPQATAEKVVAVPLAAPTIEAIAAPATALAAVSAPGPASAVASGPATGLADSTAHTSADLSAFAVPVSATADGADGLPAPGNGPMAPVPASPATTTVPAQAGSSGGGAGTKGVPIVTLNDTGTMAGLTPTHRLRYRGAGDLPRSPAAEPSTSPD